MGKGNLLRSISIGTGNFMKILVSAVVGLFLLSGIVNCGGGSAPAVVEVPTDTIQKYISKHETMVDNSLVQLYVEEEQSTVAKQLSESIAAKEAAGILGKLQQATYDFSGLTMKMVAHKEEYINDEPKDFIKVQVTGQYTMKTGEESKEISANDIVILEMEKKSWKVTEKINPWS